MKIAIDLNDVLRDFTRQFAKYYKIGYDHSFEINEDDIWTNDVRVLFPFKSDKAFEQFAYENFAYDIYGACPTTTKKLSALFNNWMSNIVPDIDSEEPIEFMIVSPMEFNLSIPSTYFFISKFGARIREILLPVDSSEIWNKCDVLITANPQLLDTKPEGKVSVKIEAEYNKESNADLKYINMETFVLDEKNIEKIIKKMK